MNSWFSSLVFYLVLAGCQPSPVEVYEQAKTAAESDDWDTVLNCFDHRTQMVMTGLQEIRKETSRRLVYPVDIQSIHPWGDILSEEIEGTRALVRVGNKRRPKIVAFVYEDGAWKIRGLHLSMFWKKP